MSKIVEWLGRAERKLDQYGKGAWIATMVIGFILVWPIGLAILGYMIWSGRMGDNWKKNCKRRTMWRNGSTGNSAFDAYREDMLRRLEDEQDAFKSFLEKLRRAKDQAEFDQFMSDRNGKADANDAVPA